MCVRTGIFCVLRSYCICYLFFSYCFVFCSFRFNVFALSFFLFSLPRRTYIRPRVTKRTLPSLPTTTARAFIFIARRHPLAKTFISHQCLVAAHISKELNKRKDFKGLSGRFCPGLRGYPHKRDGALVSWSRRYGRFLRVLRKPKRHSPSWSCLLCIGHVMPCLVSDYTCSRADFHSLSFLVDSRIELRLPRLQGAVSS